MLTVLAAAVALVACGDDDAPVAAGDGTTAPAGAPLAEEYVSVEVTEGGEPRPLVAGTEIALRFQDGSVGASLGCNQLGGPYELDGPELVVRELAMTEMGCDSERHEQDRWFADLLLSGPAVAVDGDELTLTAAETVVRFVDRDVAEPDQELVGTTWEVEGFADGQGPGSSAMSFAVEEPGAVRFDGNGFVSGSDGCNGFAVGGTEGEATDGLRYEVVGDEVRFTGDAPQTLVACPDLAEYQERFWAALTGTVSWSIDDDRLTLVGEDGGVVALRAVG